MRTLSLWLLIAALAAVQGCSMGGRRDKPAPVADAGGKTAPRTAAPAPKTDPGGVEVFAYQAPVAPQTQTMEMVPLGAAPARPPGTEAPAAAPPPALAYSAPPKSAFPSDSPVAKLVVRSDEQRRDGDLAGAAATLERALRVEPRNAQLWNRLARVRLDQGSFEQAGSLAAKSNTLAGDEPGLREDNRRIIDAAAQRR